MPTVPKWLGNVMENVFSGSFTDVTVTATEYLTDTLKLVSFSSPDIITNTKMIFTPGQKIEFRVSDTDYRHYTPATFNKTKGSLDVLFYLHDKGPGSQWASQLTIGMQLKMIGPGGKMQYRPSADIHIVFGDETSLGIFKSIRDHAVAAQQQCYCFAELLPAHTHWPDLIQLSDLSASTLEPASRAQHAIQQFTALASGLPYRPDQYAFYLTGNARSIQSFRNGLLPMGFKRSQVQTDPYWTEGKRGL